MDVPSGRHPRREAAARMSVQRYETAEGVRWRVRWREDGGRMRSRTLASKREALAFDADVRARRFRGEALPQPGRETLAAAYEEWWQLRGSTLAANTRRTHQAVWNAHVRDRFDHHRLTTLAADPQLFEQLTADMRARGVGPAAQRRVLMVLSAVLTACVQWKKIAVNPIGQVPKPPAARQRNPRPFPPAVVELICDEIRCRATKDRDARRPVGDALLVSLMSYAGLRPGEALALRFSDIGERTISVDKAVADGAEGPTKTGQGRTVPLVAPLRVDVATWRRLGGEADDDALLFPSAAGSHWTRTEFGNWRNRVWKPALVTIAARDPKLSWLRSARPYDCRGSFVSLQLRAGATPMEVASWGGHSAQVMFRHYAGVIEELVGEPRLTAEAQIEAARAALRQRTDAELAELVGSLVEQPLAASDTEAFRIFYPIEVEDVPGALDELPGIERHQTELADRLEEWIERRRERAAAVDRRQLRRPPE
jgi:integrase